MQLRPYQRAAVDATWNYLRNREGNPCIVLPTGAGKTIVLAELIREALTQWSGTRICVLAHVRELVAQNADKLRRYWPEAPLGIYSASLKRRDRFEPVIFASIQSVASKAMQMGRFDLLLIDEAHRIPLRSEGQYRQFIADCLRANPQLRIAGLTATPYRLGGGPVCGPDYILNEVCYEARVGDRAALRSVLEPLLAARPAAEWVEAFTAARVPAGLVNDVAEAFAFAESLGLSPVVETVDAGTGRRSRQPATPIRIDAAPAAHRTPPPLLGADEARWAGDGARPADTAHDHDHPVTPRERTRP